jgi:hypothetical protein
MTTFPCVKEGLQEDQTRIVLQACRLGRMLVGLALRKLVSAVDPFRD